MDMDHQTHNSIVSFIWGIANDCLRDVYTIFCQAQNGNV